jgi:hypothetical protein
MAKSACLALFVVLIAGCGSGQAQFYYGHSFGHRGYAPHYQAQRGYGPRYGYRNYSPYYRVSRLGGTRYGEVSAPHRPLPPRPPTTIQMHGMNNVGPYGPSGQQYAPISMYGGSNTQQYAPVGGYGGQNTNGNAYPGTSPRRFMYSCTTNKNEEDAGDSCTIYSNTSKRLVVPAAAIGNSVLSTNQYANNTA